MFRHCFLGTMFVICSGIWAMEHDYQKSCVGKEHSHSPVSMHTDAAKGQSALVDNQLQRMLSSEALFFVLQDVDECDNEAPSGLVLNLTLPSEEEKSLGGERESVLEQAKALHNTSMQHERLLLVLDVASNAQHQEGRVSVSLTANTSHPAS